ncbi:DUF5994 family protein [Nocardia callitridis]|uniref:DUF5994 family protein n=1 Tax=Nocardia callitridis TaxID=648753 RepID=A0ABP9KT51_9NOCA
MTASTMPGNPARHPVPPEYTPRLRLKAKSKHDDRDCVDGAWWPRTQGLLEELPDLLAVLAVRLGPIFRVVYDPREWQPAPPETIIGQRIVELLPYPSTSDTLLVVFGDDDERVVLRVIAPDTNQADAHATLMSSVASKTAVLLDDSATSPPLDEAGGGRRAPQTR